MRTLLSQFCESFETIVRPLLEPLDGSTEALSSSKSELPVREVRAELQDLRHQIETLVDKVAEQQAYVLLFGPLKSGKSTLMNALAATYVSEVSSLPAYPCMVYLSHRDERQFDVTRYSGQKERFTDPAALYLHVGRAHGELAERIRAAEEQDEAFDPALHFPEAIRKVDVRIPAGDLARSGAVLVDTPGLYSRMKFGYDRMTREFRDAASCAIFVVKSDNLFLEQVFEEFEDLLDLFSRIFLVVNLDTTKRDLSPDGSLVPSLESEDPLRIIDAFENLAMSAPLKEAVAAGRLRIYPVDLLRAASARLGGSADDKDVRGQANFGAFLGDLTQYLNSTDYLVAFLGDSIRRAHTLIGETLDTLEHPSVSELRSRADTLDSERQDNQRRRNAIARLLDHNWRAAFEELDEKLAPSIRERAKAASQATEKQVDGVLERWFGSDASLQSLVQDELIPHLRAYQEELATFVRQALNEEVLAGTAGILLATDVSADLYSAGLDLTEIGRESLSRINPALLRRDIPVPLHSSQVPVRRSIVDWLFLRGAARVREKLFGSPGSPSLRIGVEVKNRRLGDDARAAIRRELDLFKGRFFHETVKHIHRHVIGQYTTATVESMKAALRARDGVLEERLGDVVEQLMDHRKVLAHLSTLRTQAMRAGGEIDQLSEVYGGTEPERLIEPIPAAALPTIPAAGPITPALQIQASEPIPPPPS
ncbi:MAG: dynamin family protein, partial [Planctomycetota bacterium]|nr:dynamin family protein [Planctomycetota bacterium]